jgi:hypothetical protein
MFSRVRSMAVVAVAAAVAIGAAGCASSAASPSPAQTAAAAKSATQAQTSAAASSTTTAGASGIPGLVVLADGIGKDKGLWRFQAPDRWTPIGPAEGFTAIATTGNGIALANLASVEVRSASALDQPGTATHLNWPGPPPTAPVVALDRSPSGTLALVTSDGSRSTFAIKRTDGSMTLPAAAPIQSFSPVAAWLDDGRLLTLSTDKDQVSRLAVLDVTADKLTLMNAIGGVRAFAVSGDRQTIVAATESAVYSGRVKDWLAAAAPDTVVSLAADQIVWHIAVNRDGSAMAMLSGTEAADGKVTSVTELGFSAADGRWKPAFNSPVPFDGAAGQVWVP